MNKKTPENKRPEHDITLHLGNNEVISLKEIKYGRPKKQKKNQEEN
ncbi:MAG: hypothetical protein WBA93_17285 [Microcoleaceae cyanobacterium]